MDRLYILLQVVLATVFAVSAIAKLISRYSFYETLSAIGLKDTASGIVSWAFPLVELTAAGLLLAEPFRLAGELLILCMLAGFIAISIQAIREKGNRVDCQCFGDLVEEKLGAATLIRSFVLAACLVPLIAHQGETGLFDMEAMEVAAAVFSGLGIVMFYALSIAFWHRYRLAKGGGIY